MNKLYILQQCLLRKDINMMVDISLSSNPLEVSNDVYNFTKYDIAGAIPEVIEKYKGLLKLLEVADIDKLKFESFRIRFEKDGFIRPNKLSELDQEAKFIFFTSEKTTKDVRGGEFVISSGDGYRGYPLKDSNSTICFEASTQYEITRLADGAADYLVTYAK